MNTANNFDVIIIGGSYAGLSAAMALGRSLRNVLIIDSGLPCNRQTPHSHNFITQDGETPAAIANKALTQVLNYSTVKLQRGFAANGKKTETGFIIETLEGLEFTAKKLIFATGITDMMPDIKGFDQCWGISVIHCPYCHGYEFRNQKTAIMANGERAIHLASLVHNLSNQLTVITAGKAEFTTEQRYKLQFHNIPVIEKKIQEVMHENGRLTSIVFEDMETIKLDALYAAVPFKQHSEIPAMLGCELTEMGHIKTDPFQKTNIAGVFACGDNSSMMRSVSYAVATGSIAGAMVNKELVDELF
ncbi:Thioredoxin reductase [Paenimyroides ummariense]|uniref:Thioredoxin reductase n=1 Tax=Paenimyroides ummariense TaxID=913024 RepID=A0A1I4Z4K9_9FLAO|nr:NAD(P)/FAD-dependent oxidoreductase [Paenimyroides ummariense]SFN45226.1 Thioredoxin reductase [Paenimyroides ummariense]